MIRSIWTSKEADSRDLKVCFRKAVSIPGGVKSLELSLWADSRYYLWINGEFLGDGPARNWPEHPTRDVYQIDIKANLREIIIGILVWHFGTSTSQYIHGKAGLLVSGNLRDSNGKVSDFGSDCTWKCDVHRGYQRPLPRINVSQPWLEMFDASAFPEDWMATTFNDGDWSLAVELTPGNRQSLDQMPQRDIPLLTSIARIPKRILEERVLKCRGMGVRIDYKSAFYPGDTTTEDRFQTGYLITLIKSPQDQNVIVTLADRIWPEEDERLILNGRVFVFEPSRRSRELGLQKGENLLLLDISGARQRFTSDLHFLPDVPIEFCAPLDDFNTPFIGLGPFQSTVIGNIVCTDGFEFDLTDERFRRAGEVRDTKGLSRYRNLAVPIYNILFDGVKLRSTGSLDIDILKKAHPMPEVLILETREGKGDREVVLDMGGEVSGFLEFRILTSPDTQIDFRFSENLNKGVMEIPDDLDTGFRYTCAGGPGLYHSLLRRGFRYMAIRIRGNDAVHISDISIHERLFPVRHRGQFLSEDKKINAIWLMCRRTVELCSEDTMVDCPAFEQAFWIGDAYVMALYHQYLFGETRLVRHSLIMAAQSMEKSELPDCHLPSGVRLLLSTWAQLWFLACHDYWTHTAEESFIRDIYPWLEKAIESFGRHLDSHGLFSINAWNMLDWAPMDTPYKGSVAHLNSRLVACYRAIADIARMLSKPDDAKKWDMFADRLILSINEMFWDDNKAAYRDSIHADGRLSSVFSVQTNLMMLKYRCVPRERMEVVRSFVVNPPDDAVIPGSPFIAHFYYEYLFSIGQGKRALDGIREQWGEMLDHGTCWETFRGFYKDRLTRSYCHAWSSAPAYLFGAWILGIRPLSPGFKKILIAPVPSGLTRSEGIVPTPAGDIHVRWWIDKSIFHCNVQLPNGVKWESRAPEGDWSTAEFRVEAYPRR